MYGFDMKKLIGREFSGVLVSDGNLVLEGASGDVSLTPSGGDLVFRAEGDCCSETWLYRVTGVLRILGRPIAVAEEFTPDATDERSRQDQDAWYGLRLVTDAGSCEVIYRNSSNGYYGGTLEEGDSVDKAALTRVVDEWTNPDPFGESPR